MAAPYIAVGIFWMVFHSAWFALLAYHAQILWWSRGRLAGLVRPRRTWLAPFVVASALAGPAVYVVLPYVPHADLAAWLGRYGLTGGSLVAMVFYFGLVHPLLEQTHWAPLRERTPLAHVAFAGYHVLVLHSLLTLPWLAAVFAVLAGVSWLWQRMTDEAGSLVPAVASHLLADLGIVVVAWLVS